MKIAVISKPNILKFTKVTSMLVILYFGISFNIGLNELEDINMSVADFSSNMFKPAFLESAIIKSNSKYVKPTTEQINGSVSWCEDNNIEINIEI